MHSSMETNRPSDEQVKKIQEIFNHVLNAVKLLKDYDTRESSLAVTRLQEGMLWAQQVILSPQE